MALVRGVEICGNSGKDQKPAPHERPKIEEQQAAHDKDRRRRHPSGGGKTKR